MPCPHLVPEFERGASQPLLHGGIRQQHIAGLDRVGLGRVGSDIDFEFIFHVIFGAADLNLDIVAGMKFGDWGEF